MLLGDSISITFPYEIDLLFLNLKRLPIIFCYLAGGLVRYTQARHPERPKVPMRSLRLAGALEGLQCQLARSCRPLQALWGQQHHLRRQRYPFYFSFH